MPTRLYRKDDDQRPITPERDLVGQGLYTIPEAARILTFAVGDRRPWSKLRRWTFGYKYRYIEELRESEPIIEPRIRLAEDIDVVTFRELVELLVLAAFRKRGLSIKTIRLIQSAALKRYGGPYPFARREYSFLGKQVFADLLQSDVGAIARNKKLSEEVINGQMAFDEIVRPLFEKCIDYDDSFAARYWPLGHQKDVVIDPTRAFGKPIVATKGVPTAIIYAKVKAGDSAEDVAYAFDMPVEAVRDALQFEARLNEEQAA